MSNSSRRMVISPLWLQVAVLVFLVGFAVLGYLAYRVYADRPPIPARVLDENGRVLFTAADVLAGQNVFQEFGLMQYGTIFGHGAYLGPDFTADYLHREAMAMRRSYLESGEPALVVRVRVADELKTNRYDMGTGNLVYTSGQAAAFETLVEHYTRFFGTLADQQGLKRPQIDDPAAVRKLTAYFSWAAWVSAAERPGTDHSYTNNWPPEPLAGNRLTAQAVLWSSLSLIALLGGTGLLFFIIGRYDLLGWHRADDEGTGRHLEFRPPENVPLAPAQRATAWYFLVIAGLFLAQGLLGGVNAHYHVEPEGFYGFDLARWIPYNLSRMWHVQLALFFVAASYLAMGIFITPMIARREPKHQDKLALALFGALVFVVVGSLLGEAASVHGYLKGSWFWIGSQGWEYLDLGRLWQILLVVGMVLWVVIVIRGLAGHLPGEHPGNMPYLFLYSAISIPLFYGVGLVFWKQTEFVIVDFWRFWVVHLWVEDFLELFTTITVAYVYVLLGVVRQSTATRVIYLDIILYSLGGVIGTMHHLYFSGAPSVHMALGAFFSAMEVIPLVLLTFEAWRFMRLGSVDRGRSVLGTDSKAFPHKWAVMFLVAVGFWNFLGAGVFGFLINLPAVSYWEIGTQFTANHGHGALMGVYGMLAIGFFMFVARYFIPPDATSEGAMKLSFWSLNIGLALMLFANLIPMGMLQLYDSVQNGYWHARDPAIFNHPIIRTIEWLRLPGDALFLVGGILPVVYLAIRMFLHRRRHPELAPGAATEDFTQVEPQ